jgi:ABC-type transport system involved in cytochrome c biogenesis permease subunit
VYLLKDGIKTEAMAICSSIFTIAVIGSISRFSVLTTGTYRAATILGGGDSKRALPLRADIPYVGWTLVLAALLLVGVIIAFAVYLSKNDEKARLWGHRFLKASLVVQACAISLLVSQIKTLNNVAAHINQGEYARFGKWLAEQQGLTAAQIVQLGSARLEQAAAAFMTERGAMLGLSLNSNPVELSALITAFAATLFVIIFSFRTERLRTVLPDLDKLDSMMYKTGTVAFAGLAMLLITGAVWANESWGRYWGWDSKETGALVAWLTYAAFLHTRVSHGWKGRSSAYFAIVGFLLVIFTYLGVSYLLPGLHSYA